MNLSQRIAIAFTLLIAVTAPVSVANEALEAEVKTVYDSKLKELFLYFHQNPELSTMEHKTSARLADELTALGFTVCPARAIKASPQGTLASAMISRERCCPASSSVLPMLSPSRIRASASASVAGVGLAKRVTAKVRQISVSSWRLQRLARRDAASW